MFPLACWGATCAPGLLGYADPDNAQLIGFRFDRFDCCLMLTPVALIGFDARPGLTPCHVKTRLQMRVVRDDDEVELAHWCFSLACVSVACNLSNPCQGNVKIPHIAQSCNIKVA